ncbi:DUF3014 domain-containing protein [Idiomarina abyssalis]|jgi:DUF3014 family protein|uniref:DUF3014 domain-containing protein n=1 Tax=Idiomarina abyssalis TaxID=86102 RepID=A0A8I1G499_9GAMM|nr:DUF3014 domain-containing protein [Idiomarina abyssalis]MBJ7266760.1 DUF3014 domain-containing protein [Idiomarina abyssalis]MBJ7274430.1 DUF3014 domain-containing protein [Idiomarina abyssalis]MBJ7315683.1 DUF3014 domain-containing protein [Idiomarina abyssalis]
MSDDQVETSPATEEASRKTTWVVVSLIVLAVIAAIVWWWLPASEDKKPQTETVEVDQQQSSEVEVESYDEETAEPEPELELEPIPAEPEAAPEPQEPEPEPIALPELDESTPTVLQNLDSAEINIRPLKSSQLIRDAVVLMDNISNGSIVRERTIVQRPDGRFKVLEVDGELYIDESSYHRYDALVDWFVSLEADVLVENYELFKPLVQEAYAEIGYPESDFDSTLLEAIEVALDTPVPDGLVQVEDDSVMYTFADDSYESLPGAQKQLLRMGPDNIQRVKDKLREIRRALQ